jgi:hypothetical protein
LADLPIYSRLILDEVMYKRPDVLDYTAKLVCENGQYTLYLSVKSTEDIAPIELATYAAKELYLTIPKKIPLIKR